MSHYHEFGEAADGGKVSKRAPVNGCCRCADHIVARLKATRARPDCALECFMCERSRVLSAQLSSATTA